MIRNFEILGEAANHISEETKLDHPEIEWFKIRGMRNYMTHEHFGISTKIIWETSINDIPVLAAKIENIINTFRK